MNKFEFTKFVDNLNEIWPKCITGTTKNELLWEMTRNLSADQSNKVFKTVVQESNYAPSINKIKEAIEKSLGAGSSDKAKNDFLDRAANGVVWCQYCASTGMVNIENLQHDPKRGPKTWVMGCGHCGAADVLRISKDLGRYFDLNMPAYYKPLMHQEKSPYRRPIELPNT